MLKRTSKIVSFFAILAVIAPSVSIADAPAVDQKPQWQYYKDISVVGSPEEGELAKVTLDQEVFGSSKKDLRDLRVVDREGYDVPYKLIVDHGVFSKENLYSVRVVNNTYDAAGGCNSFIVDFGQGGSLNSSLNVITESENFKRTVEISGSDDMSSWSVLKADGYIYDYTERAGNFKAQDTSVDYPENSFRYIRVKIFTGGEVPLLIGGVQVSTITTKEKQEIVLDLSYEVKENIGEKTTEVIVDLAKNGWPTSGISLAASDKNFNRKVTVYESGDKASWQSVGQDYIYNYDTPKYVGANLNINYKETSKRYLKIEIVNFDDKPISITGLSTKTILRSIVFQYGNNPAEKVYRLYYGNPKANFPQYDLEKFFSYLDTGKYYGSTLSAQQANAYYLQENSPDAPLSERIPYLVPGALVLAIILMGLIVVRFMKKVGVEK